MTQYVEKPSQIEAVQWTGELAVVQQSFTDAHLADDGETCLVPSPMAPGSTIPVPLGSWVMQDVFGHINVMSDEQFALLYAPARDEATPT